MQHHFDTRLTKHILSFYILCINQMIFCFGYMLYFKMEKMTYKFSNNFVEFTCQILLNLNEMLAIFILIIYQNILQFDKRNVIRKRSLFDIILAIHYFLACQFLMRQIFQIPLCTGHKRSETFFVFAAFLPTSYANISKTIF